jgi:anti-sigma B factor antagonist
MLEAMESTIAVSTLGGVTWVTLEGELDLSGARALGPTLDALDLASTDLWLDLSGLEFIDSTGLAVLIGLANRAAEHGRRVTVAWPKLAVARLLDVVDVGRRFDIVRAHDAALPT